MSHRPDNENHVDNQVATAVADPLNVPDPMGRFGEFGGMYVPGK